MAWQIIMNEYNIKKSLSQCKKAAGIGYRMAMKQNKSLNDTLHTSRARIESTLLEIKSSPCRIPEASEALTDQLIQARNSLDYISATLTEDIIDLKANMSKFSITLFGRTMAGKSTLMEVLTNGDGSSIGKGAQRTTKDIRAYEWNDLRVIDVPGIAAFEGEMDEEIAFNAAKKSDLILFLLTDDAPQASEGECFSRIMNLGKPVIFIMNVKTSIHDSENAKMTLRNIEKAFQGRRLNDIRDQFLRYASQYGQNWESIPFVYVHLHSAFLSQIINDRKTAALLYKASKIDELKQLIITEVETHGTYYREKNFIDIVSKPTIDVYQELLFQGAVNTELREIVLYKKKQLDTWKEKFIRDCTQQIESLVTNIQAELNMEIPAFADQHYEDKKVSDAWNKLLTEKQIESRCEELSDNICSQADDRLREFAEDISKELEYAASLLTQSNFGIQPMHHIFNAKKAWNWGSLVAGGGLTIAAGILALLGSAAAGPVGWAAVGVSAIGVIGSFIFTSKEKKADKARKKLEEQLQKSTNSLCESIKQQLIQILNTVVNERIQIQSDAIREIAFIIEKLSVTQFYLADGINPNLMEQNKQLFAASLKLVHAGNIANSIDKVGRIPGALFVVMLKKDSSIPERKEKSISELLQEKLFFIQYTDNIYEIIKSVVGIPLEYHKALDHVLWVALDNPTPDLINRINIAQQFSGTYIGNEKEAYNA